MSPVPLLFPIMPAIDLYVPLGLSLQELAVVPFNIGYLEQIYYSCCGLVGVISFPTYHVAIQPVFHFCIYTCTLYFLLIMSQ